MIGELIRPGRDPASKTGVSPERYTILSFRRAVFDIVE
jgi:hypothetical protein